MPQSLRILSAICAAALAACGLAGCTQEGNGDSTAFNDLPQGDAAPNADVPSSATLQAAEFEPLVAPKPGDFLLDAPLVAAKPIAADEVKEIKLLVPERSFRTEKYRGESLLRVSYDDFDLLKILNMAPVPPDAPEYFPQWLSDLDGKRVRLRGFMVPPPLQEGIAGFLFVRDNQKCCMGPEVKIYDLVNVYMKEGVTTHYIAARPFDVVGTFRVDPLSDEYGLYGLYAIEDAVVIER